MSEKSESSPDERQHLLHNFYEQLKRRRVIRVATLYVVVFWPIIQVADILSPALNLPETGMRYLVLAFIGGFPIVLVLAWIFDLNVTGIERDTGGNVPGKKGIPLIGSRLELSIIGIMLLVVAALFYLQENFGDLLGAGNEAARVATAAGPPTSPIDNASFKSIAVLPFETFSQESRDRYFADGLTEELLNVLSRINGLKVAARTSSFAYRDVNKTVQQIGRELGVDVILEGSVRRNDVDNTIRVTAQLVNTRTGTHLWSRTFDKQFRDVFKIQDDIAAAVVGQLKVTLLGDEESRMKSRHSASPEAMIAYSMGQTEMAKRTRVAVGDALRYFQRSLDADSQYADAWVGLADANSLVVSYGWGDAQSHLKDAQTAVDKALAIDQRLGKAWASQGLVYKLEGRKQQALDAFRKAISLNPNYAMAHVWYGGMLEDQADRLEEFERAYALDPRSPVAAINVANIFFQQGREAEAMQVFNNIIEADPYYPNAYQLVARISAKRGRLDDAIRQYEKAYELQPDRESAYQIAYLETSLGNFTEAARWRDRLQSDDSPEQQAMLSWLDVQRFTMQGDHKGAREAISRFERPWGEFESAYLVATFAAYLKGDYAKAVQYWNKAIALNNGATDHGISDSIFNRARVAAAWAYRQTNELQKSAELLAETRQALDKEISQGRDSDPDLWYNYALVKAIEGNSQLALMDLQRAVDEGWHDYWRPELDPPLESLVGDEEFKGMMAGVQTRMKLIRDKINFEKSFASTQEKEGREG